MQYNNLYYTLSHRSDGNNSNVMQSGELQLILSGGVWQAANGIAMCHIIEPVTHPSCFELPYIFKIYR